MLQPRLLHMVSLLLFLCIITGGIFFLLSLQLAPFVQEIVGDASVTGHVMAEAVSTRPLPTATLLALTLDLLTAVPVPASPTPQATATHTPTPVLSAPTAKTGTVTVALVNIRSYPNLAGDVVGQAQQGEQLTILATSPDGVWLQVCCPLGKNPEPDDAQSWIAAEFVALTP
ncbi:MAG: SH3 domain-containing protein [Candidatus Berkiella sp.]|jgi:hypothetical protein